MSMNDKSYCATFCDQIDCERNIRFNKPKEKYYSVTTFDDFNADQFHAACGWKIKRRIEKMDTSTIKELIKGLIMSVKDAVDSEVAMLNIEIFDNETICNIFSGLHQAGYELFKLLYPEQFKTMDSETEETVFAKFNDFLYSREQTIGNEKDAFNNFCNWFEKEIS